MSRSVLIKTPENVELEFELAGIASRFGAALMDTLIIAFGYFAFAMLLFLLRLLAEITNVGWLIAAVDYILALSLYVVIGGFLLVWIGYYAVFEAKRNGQTPGKRAAGIRVINEGGYPITPFAALMRNMLRPVDFLPGAYGAGIISIFVNGNYQRIGDIVGGTIVIKQSSSDRARSLDNLLRAARITPEHLDKGALALVSRDADRLTPDEYLAVRHFTERRRDLEWNAQQLSAMKIAVPLMQRLNIVPPAGVTSVNYADFLEYLSVAYELARRPK